MNIEEFRFAIATAFPNSWDFKAEIRQWRRGDKQPVYRVHVIHDKASELTASAEDHEPDQAIMKCREKLAAVHADRIEDARKLLAAAGEI